MPTLLCSRGLQAIQLAGRLPDTPAAGPAPWPHPPTVPMGDYLQGKLIPRVKNEDALLSVQPGLDLSLIAEC